MKETHTTEKKEREEKVRELEERYKQWLRFVFLSNTQSE